MIISKPEAESLDVKIDIVISNFVGDRTFCERESELGVCLIPEFFVVDV